jgi:hypothetical protein
MAESRLPEQMAIRAMPHTHYLSSKPFDTISPMVFSTLAAKSSYIYIVEEIRS